MADERYPILGRGEVYSEKITPPPGGRSKDPIRTFDEAVNRLLPQFRELFNDFELTKKYCLGTRVFFKVDMDCSYLAKSYHPHSFVKNFGWELVGSKTHSQHFRDDEEFIEPKISRTVFYGTNAARIKDVYSRMERGTKFSDTEKKDIIKIDNIGIHPSKDKWFGFDQHFKSGTVELVFHPMHSRLWNECKRILERLSSGFKKANFLWGWHRGATNDPIFLPAVISLSALKEISNFNPLRAARPMPSVSIPRVQRKKVHVIGKTQPLVLRSEYPEIGIIDGGVDAAISHLKGWASNEDITPEPISLDFLEHGTAVSGASLYGSIPSNGITSLPKFRVKHFRVFPVPRENDIDLDLYNILDWIENIISHRDHQHIKVYVLSFGPNVPIDDIEVDRFTATLDRLAWENDVIFFVAAGNEGGNASPFNRIQPPSDVVNGVGVGAYGYNVKGDKHPAPYCCVGPGRLGSKIKPDVCGFGGCDVRPFNVLLAGADGQIAEEQGTSFSNPLIASIPMNIIHRVSNTDYVSSQTAKALLIHHAQPFIDKDPQTFGWGMVDISPEDIMACSPNEVKVLYNGFIDLTRWHRLFLPYPDDLNPLGNVSIDWTFVYATEVRMESPDDYTLGGLEIKFRPNSYIHTYYGPGDGKTKSKKADSRTGVAKRLLALNWTKSRHPVTANYKTEQSLREEGKWDTVQKGTVTKRPASLCKPVLDIHAIGRGDWDVGIGPGQIRYAGVVTVRAKNTNLYRRVLRAMPELVQVRMRARARKRI